MAMLEKMANPGDNHPPSFGYGGTGFLQDSTTASSFFKGSDIGQSGGFGVGGAIGPYGGVRGSYSGEGGGRGGGGGGSHIRSDGVDIERNKNHGSVIIEKVTGEHIESNQGSFTLSNRCGIQGNIHEFRATG